MSKVKLYCGGCGEAGVGAFEACPKCGWHAPTANKYAGSAESGYLAEAMRRTADYNAACVLDPSLRPPPEPKPDWRAVADLLAAAVRLRQAHPDLNVDAAVLRVYDTARDLEALDG